MACKQKHVVEWLKKYKTFDRAEETIKSYDATMIEFVNWYNANYKSFTVNIDKIDENVLYSYVEWLDDKNCASTKKKKLIHLNQFFKFLVKSRYIQHNPFDYFDMRFPKKKKRVPKHFTDEEVGNIIESVSARYKERNTLIIELFLETGLRLSELRSLNVGDIKGDTLIVNGKNDKERVVYLTPSILEKLKIYINTLVNTNPDTALFCSNRNTRLSKVQIWMICAQAEKSAGLKTGVHAFRHTFASKKLSEGADLYDIKELLGHESIATTQIYASIAQDRLRKIMKIDT